LKQRIFSQIMWHCAIIHVGPTKTYRKVSVYIQGCTRFAAINSEATVACKSIIRHRMSCYSNWTCRSTRK